MKKMMVRTLLTSFLFIGVSCGTNTTQNSTASQEKEANITFSIIEDDNEIKQIETSAISIESVLDLLKDNFDVEEEGGFVTSIDALEQEPSNNKYWLYYINGQEAEKGANETFVSEGDVIEWRLNEL